MSALAREFFVSLLLNFPFTHKKSLDIIGLVGLSHAFSTQSHESSDAARIRESWTNLVNTGLGPLALFANVFVRGFPAVARAPLPLQQSRGVVKGIVERIGQKIIAQERSGDEVSADPMPQIKSHSKDIIGLLLRARDGSDEKLTDAQILDNVGRILFP